MSLRQAAQQALEALEEAHWKIEHKQDAVKRGQAITALEQALAEPEQEPIGHADLGINNIYIFNKLEPCVVPAGRTALYTSPTPRKPLTDEELEPLLDELPCYDIGNSDLVNFARAVIAAYEAKQGEQT